MIQNLVNEKGFTLLEVIIVMGVLSIGILGVAVMQFTATGSNSRAFRMTEATNVATDRIEEILLMDATDPLLVDDNNSALRRMGIPVNVNGGVISVVNEQVDTVENPNSEGYTVAWDGRPWNDPATGAQVGIDIRLYVVWTEEAELRTVEFYFVKMI